MKKEFRIKKSNEIEEVMKANKSFYTASLRLFYKQNLETSNFRYAISVGKKVGNAVVRNYQKRRLRALFQKYQQQVPNQTDIFVVAKPNINKLSFSELEKEYLFLLKKLEKIKKVEK